MQLIHVVNKLSDLWATEGLDIHRDGISLPSLVFRYITKHLEEENKAGLYLIKPGEEEFYKMLRDNVVGGPSMIFCHHC